MKEGVVTVPFKCSTRGLVEYFTPKRSHISGSAMSRTYSRSIFGLSTETLSMTVYSAVATTNVKRVTVAVQLAAVVGAAEMRHCSANLVIMLHAVTIVFGKLAILFYIAVVTTVHLWKRAESAGSELWRRWTEPIIIAEIAGTWPFTDFCLHSQVSKSKLLINNQ